MLYVIKAYFEVRREKDRKKRFKSFILGKYHEITLTSKLICSFLKINEANIKQSFIFSLANANQIHNWLVRVESVCVLIQHITHGIQWHNIVVSAFLVYVLVQFLFYCKEVCIIFFKMVWVARHAQRQINAIKRRILAAHTYARAMPAIFGNQLHQHVDVSIKI